MITIVTGVPGSGKSYFAVHMISKLKDRSKVLHNIDGLKLGTTLDDFCISSGSKPLDLFTTDFHDKDNSFRGFLLVLDECQTLFPKAFRNESVQRFFQLHRHYGIDVVLLSQDYKLICPSIALLSEFQFRAVSDTANPLPGTFFYRKMIGYESIGRKFLPKKKSVFELYKTADFDQANVRKKSRPMLILFIVGIFLSLFAFYKLSSFSDGLDSPSSSGASKSAGPLSLSVKKSLERFSSPSSSLSSSYTIDTYPASLEKQFSGRLLSVSSVSDSTGTYIPFLGFLFKITNFPYPLMKSHSGYVALLPGDVFNYALEYRSSIPEPDTLNTSFDSSPPPAQATDREGSV